MNDKAMNAIFGAVDSSQYKLISNCSIAKEAWDILQVTHEGNNKVKIAKFQLLMSRFENLQMEEKESITEFHGRVREIANQAARLEEPIAEKTLVLKVLRALPERFRTDVKAIRQAHDVSTLSLDELMGNLETVELELKDEQIKKKSDKQIAFHGKRSDADEDVPDDDATSDTLSMFIQQFRKWNQRKGKNFMQGNSSKNAVNSNKAWKNDKAAAEENGVEKKGIQCFECSGFGHVQKECPNYLKKKRQAFATCWSEDGSDNDEEEATENQVAFTSVKGATRSNWADVADDVSEDDTAERLEILEEKWTELLRVNKKNILDKDSLISEKERLKKELDEANLKLKDIEEIQENQTAELKQFKELFKLLRNSGSEALDQILASGKSSKDHTGLGYSKCVNEDKVKSNPVFIRSTGKEILSNKVKVDEAHVLKADKEKMSDVEMSVRTSGRTFHGEGSSAYKKFKSPVVSHSQNYNRVSHYQPSKMNQNHPSQSRSNLYFRRNKGQKHQGHSHQHKRTTQSHPNHSGGYGFYRKNAVQKQRNCHYHGARNVVQNVTTPRRTLQPRHQMEYQVKSFHNYICFYCNEKGHIRSFCRKLYHRRSHRPIAQKPPRKIWVKKDDIGFTYPYLQETSEQRSSSNKCSHYMTDENDDVEDDDRSFKELWLRPSSSVFF
jgi:hypothetical protein